MNLSQHKLQFPLQWHGKIITKTETQVNVAVELQNTIKKLGYKENIQKGNTSKTGKYLTYNISLIFTSKQNMDSVTNTIAQLNFVKLVI